MHIINPAFKANLIFSGDFTGANTADKLWWHINENKVLENN
jgi:hypothetical protein